jgi:hypothetical protein
MLRGSERFGVTDFLLTDRAQLEPYKKGEESIALFPSQPPLAATRYERTSGDQTLTFWLSDAARPIGLLQLVSRGPKPSQNYALRLRALLRNVGRKIDPAKAR